MDRTDHLISATKNYKENEKLAIFKVAIPEEKHFYVPFFEGFNVAYAIFDLYISEDTQNAKQCFYNAARIREYIAIKYELRLMDSGIFPLSFALLSDCESLIERYSIFKDRINDITSIGFQLPNAVQNILLGQWDKLDVNIRNLERFVKFPKFKWYAASVEVFKGFRAADKTAIEAGLQEMIKTHSKRNREELIPKFLSVDTAGYCKLAWRLGYEIDLKSELVPIELMPIEPLDHYEDYDFLKD